MLSAQDSFAKKATRRGLDVADGLFPTTLKPDTPDLLRVSIALFARCMTTAEVCLQVASLERRGDLMVLVRSLFEHLVMFAWLTGSKDGEHRLLLWQRYCDEHALKLDNEVERLGGQKGIFEKTRAQIAEATEFLGDAVMPNLADRAACADKEWADRLDLDPEHRDAWSLRRTYAVIYRPGSAFVHPTLAGLSLVMDKNPDRVDIYTEPALGSEMALLPVPALVGTSLAIAAHTLGQPTHQDVAAYIDWLAQSKTELIQ